MPPPAAAGHASASKVARNRRRHKGGGHEEEGGSERWLVTYADMLTLLLVLFIVLFSISVVNTSKFISLKTSLASAFNSGTAGILSGGTGLNENSANGTGTQLVMPGMPVVPAKPGAPTASTASTASPQNPIFPSSYTQAQVSKEVSDFKKVEKSIDKALHRSGLAKSVRFSINRRGLVITVVTNALVFPGNSATLLGQGGHILSVIAPPLAGEKRQIEVDGNTNQLKVGTGIYPNGWALSSARASTVTQYLSDHGVSASRLSAVGYSDQHPLVPASDPRSVTLNRRVDIVVLSSLPASAGDALQTAGKN